VICREVITLRIRIKIGEVLLAYRPITQAYLTENGIRKGNTALKPFPEMNRCKKSPGIPDS
jgi:hypothetical protein